MRIVSFMLLSLWGIPALGDTLQARFIGNAAFEITDGATTLLTDFAYTSGAFGYMKYKFEDVKPAGKVLCLITHNHSDHWDATLFKKTDWSLAAPIKLVRKVDPSRIVPFGPKMQFDGMQITPIKTDHADVFHWSYLVEWHGMRLYFTGDTEETGGVTGAGKIDVLFVTPWLLERLILRNSSMDAKRIVVYHHLEGEAIPKCAKCMTPKQGETFSITP